MQSESLVFAGKVGTGFSVAMARDLRRRLEAIERRTPPFAPPLPAAVQRPRPLGPAEAGRRGGVHRVDQRRAHPSSVVPGSAPRQTSTSGDPGTCCGGGRGAQAIQRPEALNPWPRVRDTIIPAPFPLSATLFQQTVRRAGNPCRIGETVEGVAMNDKRARLEPPDISEHGGLKDGQRQRSDERLFMQLLAFTNCSDTAGVIVNWPRPASSRCSTRTSTIPRRWRSHAQSGSEHFRRRTSGRP